MELTARAFLLLVVVFIGCATAYLLHQGQRKLLPGLVKDFIVWLFYSTLFFGIPYAIWTFFIEIGFVSSPVSCVGDLYGNILVTLFFISMLQASRYANKLGQTYGFKE